jgi:hypothetical protein
LLFAFLGALAACRPGEPAAPEVRPAAAAKPADVLIFPDALHVADASVNAFVERAMRVCGDGDYEAFRLLWSAKAEPLPRDEFEQGWQAVEQIRIRALRKAIVAGDDGPDGAESPGESVYLVLAEVAFDPDQPAGRREPQRDVVLMLRREQGEWRVSRAPDVIRDWIREQAADEGADRPEPPSTD